MYFIIAGWGYANRVYASMKFFIFTLAGSALMLVGMLALVFLHASATGGHITFDLVALAKATQGCPRQPSASIFLAFVFAFGIKVPLFPIHTWLPDAHTEAPTGGSVILAGVLLKLGHLRHPALRDLPVPAGGQGPRPRCCSPLPSIGMIYGALVATVQKDLKRLVAYSSVAHLGFIVLGLFAFTTQGMSRRRDPDGQPRTVDRAACSFSSG